MVSRIPKLWLTDGVFGSGYDYLPVRGGGGNTIMDMLLDINGDRRPDRVAHYKNGTYGIWVAMNKGESINNSGFEVPELWLANGVFGSGYDYLAIRGIGGYGSISDTFLDINGDGRPDRIVHYDQGNYGIRAALSKQENPELIASIKNGRGAQIDVSYKPATQVDGAVVGETSSYPNAVVNNAPRSLVTDLTVDGGIDEQATTRYEYSDGKMKIGFRWEVENLGFSQIKKIDDVTGNYVVNIYLQNLPYHGLVDSVEGYDADDNLLSKVKNAFAVRIDDPTNFPEIKFVHKKQVDTYQYFSSGALHTRTKYDTYDSYGNVTKRIDYGDMSVTNDNTETYTEFAINLTNYVIVPKKMYSKGYELGGTTLVLSGETRLFYDGYTTLGAVTNGLMTKRETKNGADDIVETFGYDAFGSEIWYKDGRVNSENFTSYSPFTGYTKETEYDSLCHVYVVKETNALAHETTYDYDTLLRLKKITDPNGIVTAEYEYDAFGNITKTIRYGDSSTYPTQKTLYNFTDTMAPTCIITKSIDGAESSTIDTYTYYDGLGRVIQVATKAAGMNKWIIADTYRDHLGRAVKESVPYYWTGTRSPTTTTRDTSQKYTQTDYNDRDLVSKVTNPDGTYREFGYNLRRVIVTDESGHTTTTEVVGATKTITEISSLYSPNPTTVIESGIDGIRVTNEAGNEIVTTLDMLKRKIAISDPDIGDWEYSYDANGNLVSQTDGRGNTINFAYDPLDRIEIKDYLTGVDTTYTYGDNKTVPDAQHGYCIGLLIYVDYAVGSESFKYDGRGRVTKKTRTIDAITHAMEYVHDSLDRITACTYPDGEIVEKTYTSQGLNSLTSATANPDYDYVESVSYNALNKLLAINYGNGIDTTYDYYDTISEYDASAGTYFSFRLHKITTSASSILNLEYEYDKVGNVKKRTDHNNASFTETYGYDDLDRLTSASSTVYGSKWYSYDEVGNITQKDGRYYSYSTTSNRLINDGSWAYTYDGNGNPTTIDAVGSADYKTLQINDDNMISEIYDSESSAFSYFDYFDDERVRKEEGGVITRYFFPEYELEEVVSTSTFNPVKYYFANGRRIARDYDGTLTFFHSDHLGSSTRITDYAGTVVRSIGYMPYGSDSYTSGSAEVFYKFTGQEQDNTGFYYYGARYYDPVLGRFLQADSIIPYPNDPQSYNRYSYTRNNPVLYVDPTGNLFGIDDLTVAFIIKSIAVGAATGAAQAAITGGDILEGALHGAISGLTIGVGGTAYGFAGVVAGGAAGGAISASISGGDVGLGALTGAISVSIGAAVQGSVNPVDWVGDLSGFAVSGFSGSLSGGITAEIQGGDFWQGAADGAIGGVVAYSIASSEEELFGEDDAWKDIKGTNAEIEQRVGKDQSRLYRETGIHPQINDNKYGHAMQVSYSQKAFGLIAAPVITGVGLLYELKTIFVPGHVQGVPSGPYVREAPFFGMFDGQHPLNWLWDTPGDVLANTYGQAIGIAAIFDIGNPYILNQATLYIPGPDYRTSPWTEIAYPSVPKRK